MKIHVLYWGGLLAAVLFGCSAAAQADSVAEGDAYRDVVSGFAAPATESSTAHGIRRAGNVCCSLPAQQQRLTPEELLFGAFEVRSLSAARPGNDFDFDAVTLPVSRRASLGSSFDVATASEYGSAATISYGAAGFGYLGLDVQGRKDSSNSADESSHRPSDDLLQNGNSGRPVKLDVWRGRGTTAQPAGVPLQVSEPQFLTLLAAGLTAAGLLLLKRSA
jgi:hypothetical protein